MVAVFVHNETLECVLSNKCVVCLYRLVNKAAMKVLKDQLQDSVMVPPNQRPETCPRATKNGNTRCSSSSNSSSSSSNNKNAKYCGLYRRRTNILTLGDGDFSFSLSLVRGGHFPDRLFATSFESYNSITSVYPNAADVVESLKSLNVPVLHGVDATDIANSSMESIPKHSFDVIVWNFPCLGEEHGADGQAREIEANQQLLRSFFVNAADYLSDDGKREVHVTHKTIEPFSWWNIEELASQCGYSCAGAMIFDRCLYPGYINRKALEKSSFPSSDAITYVFVPKSDNHNAGDSKHLQNSCLQAPLTPLSVVNERLRQHIITNYPNCPEDINQKKRRKMRKDNMNGDED